MTHITSSKERRLPLATLFKYPTVKLLAEFIEQNNADETYKSLIPIQTEGSKIPLYIIHGIGLNLLNFHSMVLNMDTDQPVYGLQALGLNGLDEPLDNLEDVAAFYNSEILKHNPNGPYAIAGYSFGGYIAFEMARQLKKAGKNVVLLGMFDTNVQYATHQYDLTKRIIIKSLRQLHKLRFRLSSIFNEPVDNVAYFKAVYSEKIKTLFKLTGYLKEYDQENLPPFMQEIIKKLETAFYNYIIKPSDVKIDLFTAEKRLYFVDEPKYLGWRRFALQGVTVHVVPGDHKEMFSLPNVKALALILQTRLNEINPS